MSEPEKKPAKVEPAIDDIAANDEIVGASPAAPAVPATPAPAVVEPVNDNTEEAAPAAAAPKSRLRGFLKGAFNVVSGMAMGAAVSAVAKTAAVVGMTIAGAPAWATILGSGVAVGIGSTLLHDALERRKLKKTGAELPAYFSLTHGKELLSKKNLKVFGLSTTFAIAGSALFLGLQSGTIQGWLGFGPDAPAVPPVVVPPVETAVVPPVVETVVAPPVDTVVVPPVDTAVVPPVDTAVIPPVETIVAAPICLSPTEQFAALIDGHDVSARVTDAIARSASTNAHVAAQGAKDLAFFAFNGMDGVPKDASVAVELFKQAAEGGNMQAKVDLLYMQYHGLGGVPADKTAALGAMQDMKGARAAMFVREWGGAGRVIEHVKFDTSTILKGMTVGCPTP
ncbi:MAG: sel1 repeat family protein [Alphaproteobacteria bacterium]|nr:sel1 repeat family protein [Alphaproteobacteria bacterium]